MDVNFEMQSQVKMDPRLRGDDQEVVPLFICAGKFGQISRHIQQKNIDEIMFSC
jgi:hypothetical protein